MTQSVWDIAVQQFLAKEESQPSKCDPTLVLVGNKGSGKSTILHHMLERDDKPKPTLALDYSFGRRTCGGFAMKSVVHIWELGGGTKLADLIEVAISPGNIWNLHLVLVLDLSKPCELWAVSELFLNKVKRRFEEIRNRLAQRDKPQIRKRLELLSHNRLLPGHPDHDLMDPFPVPLLIIASKYDLFTTFPLDHQKLICKTLRFLNHYYKASLYFVTVKDEASMKRIKVALNHVSFGTGAQTHSHVDLGKPLSIPEGADSFANIGAPPNVDMLSVTAKTPLEMWKNVYCSKFPQVSLSELNFMCGHEDIIRSPKYAEPLVDTARAAKEEELERKLTQGTKRMKELLQLATGEGVLIA